MPSPFPGMDPYLETPERWRNVHHNLATEIQAQLAPLLRPRYYVDQEPRFVLELLITTDLPERLNTVVIRTVAGDELVTAIEILSATNKRPGHAAYVTYLRKRQAILESTAHLLELDLLRAGERLPLAEPLPEAPYFAILSRSERRPVAEVWPLRLQEPIPVLPVPLLPPDTDLPLDLGRALAVIYDRSGYDLRIDYTQPPPLPPLSAEETAWLDKHLRAGGAR